MRLCQAPNKHILKVAKGCTQGYREICPRVNLKDCKIDEKDSM